MIQQKQNHCLKRTAAQAIGGLNAFYWYPISAIRIKEKGSRLTDSMLISQR